jgi:hypothetical protein
VLAWAAVGFADNPSGCDFSPANNGTPNCQGPLSPSTFEGGDGNLLVNTPGKTDWANVAGLNPGFDLPSGSGDNSFGQGTKEDSPNVSVVSGSIPPNKSDLTRFYEASEFSTANHHNFLYLAWERSNVLGSANMDFEINQATTPGLGSPGAHTINRTAGDLLVTFDFTNGGGTPTLGLLRWLTAAAGNTVSQCFSSKTLPCWGSSETLNGTDSIGAVNNLDSVTDPLFPSSPNYINPLPALQFGETAIDLTNAGVFPAGTCEAFGSTFLKSRASASFTAEVKDFIAPVPVNISNCGTVNIIKHTDPRGVDQNFSYTSTIPDPPAGQTTPTCTLDTTPSSFTLNDHAGVDPSPITGTDNTEHCANVPAGSYTVTEGAEPGNFTLESLTCAATGTGSSGSQDSTTPAQADITLTPGGVVTCTYTNQQHLGALKILKTSSKAAATPLAGAKFSITDPNGTALPGSPFTTDSNGVVCVDGLAALGNYTVRETAPPTGYAIDDSTAHTVNVTGSNAKCGDATFNGQSLTFTDTPLTDVTATAVSEVAGGTQSTITCVDSSVPANNIGNSPQGPAESAKVSANGLKPGDYTCTIHIDP